MTEEKDIMTQLLEKHLPDLDEYVLIEKPDNQPAQYVGSFNYARKAVTHAKANIPYHFWYILNKNTLETISTK